MALKLQTRYSLSIIFIVSLVAAILTITLAFVFKKSTNDLSVLNQHVVNEQLMVRATGEGEYLVKQLAENMGDVLVKGQVEAVQKLSVGTLAHQDVNEVLVLDEVGAILFSVGGKNRVLSSNPSQYFKLISGAKWGEALVLASAKTLEISSPVYLLGSEVGSVHLSYSLHAIQQQIDTLQQALVHQEQQAFSRLIFTVGLAALILMGVGILASIFMARKMKEPINTLALFAQNIGEGGYHQKIQINRNDELGELSQSLNQMASRLEKRTKEIEFLAYHDALTELPNRDCLKENLAVAIARSQREESDLALLFIDIDNFKLVNDAYGHEAGDFVLIMLAKRVTACLQGAQIQSLGANQTSLGRLAGDEFIILLEGPESKLNVAAISQLILDTVSSAYQWKNTNISLSISIGIAVHPINGDSVDSLLRNADAAMYHVKNLGKNNFHFFSPEMNRLAREQLDVAEEFTEAIKSNQLILWYQPQYDLLGGTIVGIEALLRWQHPTRGLLQPDFFIPLIEKSALIYDLGEWVINEACQQLKVWHSIRPELRMGINISPLQLQRQGWLDEQLNAVTGMKNLAAYIDIEITESYFLHAKSVARHLLDNLRQQGFRIWLDDFGTGFSSLNHLKNFPVDGVKIDRHFISGMSEQWESRALTNAIVQVAQAFAIPVIAEGVETVEQEKQLIEMGCQLAQGYRYSRALPAEEFTRLLNMTDLWLRE